MKKVLFLMGSPRPHGNSAILCDAFAKGAAEAGHMTEKLPVGSMHISGCLGCNACYRSGGSCVQKDAMEEIREKMLSADVIVLASPIYFYSMSGQLKNVLDRCYAFYQQLEGKTFYFLISCAAPDESYTQTMLDTLHGFTRCVPDAKEGGTVIAFGTNNAGDAAASPAVQQAYDLGRSL